MKPMIKPTAVERSGRCSAMFKLLQHTSSHHATHLHCALLAGLRHNASGSFVRLSSVDGPRAPCGIDPTGTGISNTAL
jgi:hypothetical protein